MGVCASNQAAGAKDEHDYAKIESYLRAHTSLGAVLSGPELSLFARRCHLVDFVAGVSLCADGELGRDWYLLAEGAVSIYLEEELFCAKNKGDYICMAARFPADSSAPLPAAPPVDEAAAAKAARLSRVSLAADGANSRAGFAQCLAVSTSPSRLVHLPREGWLALAADPSAAASRLCERIYPLLVEPTPSIAPLHFFRGLSARMLQLVGLMFRAVHLQSGRTLFRELDEGASLFIVADGSAEAFVQLEDGSEKRLKTFAKGEMMGEIALIMNVPRTAAVRATSDSLLLELHRENFQRFIRIVPTSGNNIHSVMKSRTAEHFRKYKIPFFNSIPEEKYILLASLCKIEQIDAGQVVFKEGDRAECFYIIAHGEMKVTVRGKTNSAAAGQAAAQNGTSAAVAGGGATGDGVELVPVASTGGGGRGARGSIALPSPTHKRGSIVGGEHGHASTAAAAASSDAAIVDPVTGERELTRMGPGRYFGEIALVQDSPRTATVTALTRSVVLSITQQNFQRFFEEAPEAIADFEVKLARYDVRLRSVLYHPVGLQFFQEHLKREYSEENLDFWKECRDFRHLSYADIPASAQELEAVERELDAEVEAELRRVAALAAGGQSGPSLSRLSQSGPGPAAHSPRARRQSLARIQGLDVAAAFDLFADEAAKAAALAQAEAQGPAAAAAAAAALRDGVMSLDSLVEMLKFFEIPLPSSAADRTGVLLEMAAQLGDESALSLSLAASPADGAGSAAGSVPSSSRGALIPRGRFVRVLVQMENGHFPELMRKNALHQTLEQIQMQREAERTANRSGEWEQDSAANAAGAGALDNNHGSGTPKIGTPGGGGAGHTRDPTSDYLPPDLVSEPALAGGNSGASARSLSLASKLLLKLTRLILDVRVAKLCQTFSSFDVDRSGTIDLPEFECMRAAIDLQAAAAAGGGAGAGAGQNSKAADAEQVARTFAAMDADQNGSLSLLEFIHFVFLEKKSAKALQAIVEARARHIYHTYISDRAPRQVNIRGPAQRRLKAIMEHGAGAGAEAPTPKSALSAARPTPSPSPTAAAAAAHPRPDWGHRNNQSDATSSLVKPPAGPEHSSSSAAAAAAAAAAGGPGGHSGITQSMFDDAEGEIMTLMAADSFSRFKQSELFQSFLMAAGAYNFKGPSLIDETKIKPAAAADKIEASAAAAAAAARAPAASMALKAPGGAAATANGAAGGNGANGSAGTHGSGDYRPQLTKLRSGSVMLTPRGGSGGIAEGIAGLSDDALASHLRAASGGQPNGSSGPDRSVSGGGPCDADSDAEDFPDGPAADPLEVEVVALEQFGVDSLVVSPSLSGAAAPPGSAMLMRGHRASLVLPPRTGGSGAHSGGGGGGPSYPGRSSTKSVFYSVGCTPVGADTMKLRKGAAARTAVGGATFASPAALAEEESVAPRSSRAGPSGSAPAPATPVRPAAHSAAAASSSTPAPAPAPPAPLDTDDDAGQSFTTPSKGGGGGGDVAGRNPLQSPAPPRSQPLEGLNHKNPVQSPAVGRGSSAAGAVAPAAFSSADSVPPPPLATLNDADLHKHPLQSPAFQRKCGDTVAEFDSDDEAVPPPPREPPPHS